MNGNWKVICIQRRPIRDTTAKNALAKFDAAISKKYAEQLDNFNEEDYRQLEYLNDLFKFLDEIVPLDDGEETDMPRTRARKRCELHEVIIHRNRNSWNNVGAQTVLYQTLLLAPHQTKVLVLVFRHQTRNPRAKENRQSEY